VPYRWHYYNSKFKLQNSMKPEARIKIYNDVGLVAMQSVNVLLLPPTGFDDGLAGLGEYPIEKNRSSS